jgi:UDP-N-acetyl-D-glucosamine dehydrogenase
MKNELLKKIQNHSAKIGVVGLGYVGLPLCLRMAEAGYQVLGFDVDQEKVKKINHGENYLRHISSDRVATAASSKKLQATTDFKRASEPDALIICVPTPLDLHQEPDMSFVQKTVNALAPHMRKGQLISLESTVYPGATDDVLLPPMQERGFKIGEDVFVVFSPEREDPGNAKYHTANIPKVVGGVTPACLEIGAALYEQAISQVVRVSSPRAAEMTKLLENIYRAVNIGLVNELKVVSDQMGIDIWEVIQAASTKPFGFTPFFPGPGLGGHCIPIDPFYLTWKAKEYGVHTRFIELAGQINRAMPQWVVEKVMDALNDRGKAVKNSKILVLGLAYKKNIDDARESPTLELIKLLEKKGARVDYADPFIPSYRDEHHPELQLKSVQADEKTVSAADCVLISTDHDSFDYAMIQRKAALIVDTRGRFKTELPNVVKA